MTPQEQPPYFPTPVSQSRLSVAQRLANLWLGVASSTMTEQPRSGERADAAIEYARRSQLAAWLYFGLFLGGVTILPLGLGDPPTLYAVLAGLTALLISIVCNRLGQVTVGASLLVLVVTAGIVLADVSAPGGQLDTVYLPSYDLLVIPLVITVTLLAPWMAFVDAIINSLLMAGDFLLQPHSANLTAQIQSSGIAGLLGRPIGIQIIIAVVLYLNVIGSQRSQRARLFADRARQQAAREAEVQRLNSRYLEENQLVLGEIGAFFREYNAIPALRRSSTSAERRPGIQTDHMGNSYVELSLHNPYLLEVAKFLNVLRSIKTDLNNMILQASALERAMLYYNQQLETAHRQNISIDVLDPQVLLPTHSLVDHIARLVFAILRREQLRATPR